MLVDLARELGPDQPLHALQSVGLYSRHAPLDTIEAMAKRYLSDLRIVQPNGPYALIGVCFGSAVAYEMTRQLLATGEEVAFLGLLDPIRRERKPSANLSASRAFRFATSAGSLAANRLRLYLDEMRGLGHAARVAYLARKLGALRSLTGQRDRNGIERELKRIEVYRANHFAHEKYRHKALNGRLRALEIFETARRGKQGERKPFDCSGLWEGRISRHLVPGVDAGDMQQGENARVFAALLAQRLRVAYEELQKAR
jgi:thioesterase domain-containing protein